MSMKVRCCLLCLIVAVLAVSCSGDSPISEQSCAELAETEQRIVDEIADQSRSFDQKRQTSEDAVEVDDRINELGGCPQDILQ